MTSRLEVYNGALLHLASEPLVSLNEQGTKRRKLDAAWDVVMKWCLEQALWNFAIRAVEMDETPSANTEFGYSFVFDKPDDWVRTAALTCDEYGRVPLLAYEDRADVWLADVSPVWCWYVSKDEEFGMDLGKWPATFQTFAEYALAHRTCKAITGSTDGVDRLGKDMLRAKRDAANKDAMNSPATRFPPTGRLVASRGRSFNREGRYRSG